MLLRVTDLVKHFPIRQGILFQKQVASVKAVDGISFELPEGQTLGLVGESGCGKSTTARLVMRLLQPTSGSLEFEGRDITTMKGQDLRGVRREMQMIFQDPYASLNPRMTVRDIIAEPMIVHGMYRSGRGMVRELLDRVGLNPDHASRYPHEFSGGQRQRIGIARALALRPKLIVCDEPVSALDVSVRAQVLNLLTDLQAEFKLTYLFISHDLSVVRQVCDRIAVMYLGKIVEVAPSDVLYRFPKHPYTGALLSAVPIPDPALHAQRRRIILQGDVPSPIDPPSGCRFHPRCPHAQFPTCSEVEPSLSPHRPGQIAACHFPLADREVTPVD
ncbi:MAG: ABC transporter ATP-binding protein [Actinobacteria bacterium]|nr:ABC transporter ATP-binding protein [Actinomycetota bacterium]